MRNTILGTGSFTMEICMKIDQPGDFFEDHDPTFGRIAIRLFGGSRSDFLEN